MKREIFEASDGKRLSVAVWDEGGPFKAAVVIAHGMAEHIARYDEFARYLNSRGYLVLGADQRAHGETDRDRLGLAKKGDLFESSVRDITEIVEEVKRRGYKTALLGHSYGSFLSQRVLSLGAGTELFACVLVGSALQRGAAVRLGKHIAKRRMKRKKDEPGKTFASLTFGSYDRKFGEGVGGWLNSDPASVGEYNADPLCGFTCSNGFYYYFFSGLMRLWKEPHAMLVGLPVLLVSGADDLVGGRGKLVRKLFGRLSERGADVTIKMVEGARHEVLNEPSRADTYAAVADFLDASLK